MSLIRTRARDALQSLKQTLRAINRRRLYQRRLKDDKGYASWIANTERIPASTFTPLAAHGEPWLTVILPLVSEADVPEALRSLQSLSEQACSAWQVVVCTPQTWQAKAMSALAERTATLHTPQKLTWVSTEGSHLAELAHAGLHQAKGEWVSLMLPGDTWHTQAVSHMAEQAALHPQWLLLYPDTDCWPAKGERQHHHFKPDWNPEFLHSNNYLRHHLLLRRSHLLAQGGYCPTTRPTAPSPLFDATLSCTTGLSAAHIGHLPEVLMHSAQAPAPLTEADARTLAQHLAKQGMAAPVQVQTHGVLHTAHALPAQPPKVSILICTRDQLPLLRTCVTSIEQLTTYPDYEIIIVDNGSVEARTLAYLDELRLKPERFQVIRNDAPFNYSALNNEAANHARGSVLALLNNDIEVIEPRWLDEMVGHALHPEVGCVGAKLLYPDDTIQHAGVLVGGGDKRAGPTVATHYFKGLERSLPGYANRAVSTLALSAVTGACLVVRKDTFDAVGGLNARELAVAYNDVDFCLRVAQLGLRHVWAPFALLYHHESVSRGRDKSTQNLQRFAKELAHMTHQWAAQLEHDPAYNPQLDATKGDFLLPSRA